jgi:hypothetical protein
MARQTVNHTERVVEALGSLGGQATWAQLNGVLGGVNSTTHRMLQQALSEGAITHERGQLWRLGVTPLEVETSARGTILRVLKSGEAEDDRVLMERVIQAPLGQRWRSLGMHSLDHQLFSMEKAGLIEMNVKRDGSVQRITRIRLPKVKETPMVDPYHPTRPTVEAEAKQDDFLALGGLNYPLLASLRARAQARAETSRRADAYLAAASALDGVAQDESDRLMALANDLANGVALSPIEAEYLRFADEKETSNG